MSAQRYVLVDPRERVYEHGRVCTTLLRATVFTDGSDQQWVRFVCPECGFLSDAFVLDTHVEEKR